MPTKASMKQKEASYLQAILATAAGYIEANISKDEIVVRSRTVRLNDTPPDYLIRNKKLGYSDYMSWWAKRYVTAGMKTFQALNNPHNLQEIFAKGDKRASGLFTVCTSEGDEVPCRQVVYLYQDASTNDVMAFNVLYDLTAQQRREREMKQLETELALSRMRVFTGQIQPHFLYNALASIQEIMLDDPKYASKLIGDFATHLRGSIRAMSSDDPISFSQELANIQAYVNIERMRLGPKLRVFYDTPAVDFLVPPLSIQPLVENAIRHGVYGRGPRGGEVLIKTSESQREWVVCVSDTGIGFDVSSIARKVKEGADDCTGIQNVIFRLRELVGASVDYKSKVGVGTSVTVRIPKEFKSRRGVEGHEAERGLREGR